MLNEAVKFVTEAHGGMYRKGTQTPYILHPLEAATIVARLTNDQDLVIAALLHDVLEDTDITYNEIKDKFGEKVADIVQGESEDKSKTWKERKNHTINTLKNEPVEVKIVALGDKLSNMRSIAKDYNEIGDELWERFNEKNKATQGWYYMSLIECFEELKNSQEYKEYKTLASNLFASYINL